MDGQHKLMLTGNQQDNFDSSSKLPTLNYEARGARSSKLIQVGVYFKQVGTFLGLAGLVMQIFPSLVIDSVFGKNAVNWMVLYRILNELTLVLSIIGMLFGVVCRLKCFKSGRFTRLPFWINFSALILSLMPFL